MEHAGRVARLSSFGLVLGLLSCAGGEDEGRQSADADPVTTAVSMEACAVVTAEDATALFGVEANRDESSTPIPDPNLAGECLWSHDTETSSHLLQVHVLNGERYYGSPKTGDAPEGSEPIALGDRGHVWARAGTLVDVEWVQDGQVISLSYSTVGTEVGGAERVEEMKALARRVSERLATR